MPILIRCCHGKLWFSSYRATYFSVPSTSRLQQCLTYSFTSGATQKLVKRQSRTLLEQELVKQNCSRACQYLSFYTTKASKASSLDSQSQTQLSTQNLQDEVPSTRERIVDDVQEASASSTAPEISARNREKSAEVFKDATAPVIRKYIVGDSQPLDTTYGFHLDKTEGLEVVRGKMQEAPGPALIRKHYGRDHISQNTALGIKYLFKKTAVPGMAQHRSKREDDAVIEEFLGNTRVTKHDIVSEALKESLYARAARAYVVHRRHKFEQGIHAWSETLRGNKLQKKESSERQSPITREDPFDLLNTIGSGFQADGATNGSSSALEDTGNLLGNNHEGESKLTDNESFDTHIDWDNLPLSPLMHPKLIIARTKFHLPKLLYTDATDYDKEKGWKIANDYVADMLVSPVRTCRVTYARLPRDFLINTQPIQHPETGQLWELPKDMKPQDVARDLSPSDPASADTFGTQFTNDPEPQPTQSSNSAQDSGSMPGTLFRPEQPNVHSIDNNMNSYIMSTQAAIQTVSDLPPTRYVKTIPPRWRAKLESKLITNMYWRKDMPVFIHSLAQRQITKQLRILGPSINGEYIRAYLALDRPGSQNIETFADFKTCVILYFGIHEKQAAQETSFESIVNTMASSQAFKGQVLDDLLRKTQVMERYSHLVRIQIENGENILVFDMTRLLSSNFAQSLFDDGFNQPAYCIADKSESSFLRKRLWWLAHYLKNSVV